MKLLINLQSLILCPYQVLIDINEQLSRISNELKQEVFTPICSLETTSDWIKLIQTGTPAAIKLEKIFPLLSATLAENLIKNMELHINLQAVNLTNDNLFSLLFLANFLEAIEIFFYVTPQNNWISDQNMIILKEIKNLNIHIRHELPNDIETVTYNNLAFNRQNILAQNNFKFSTEILTDKATSNDAVSFLTNYADMCLRSGCHELAARSLKRMLTKDLLDEPSREYLFIHLQEIYMWAFQFQAVADNDFPDNFNHIQPCNVKYIYFMKAFAATVTRNIPMAGTYLKKADVTDKLILTNLGSLYQLNLYALFVLLKGNIELALAMELRIKDHIREHMITDFAIITTNLLNLATLYKKLNHFEMAKFYYEALFDCEKKAQIPSSDIEYNIHLGSLSEAMGKLKEALYYWIAAAKISLNFDLNKLSRNLRLILCKEHELIHPAPRDKVYDYLCKKNVVITRQVGLQYVTKI